MLKQLFGLVVANFLFCSTLFANTSGDLCLVKFDIKSLPEKVETCTTAIAETSDQTLKLKLINQRAYAFYLAGQYKNSYSDIESVLKIESNNLASRALLPWLHKSVDDLQTAFDGFTDLITDFPNSAEGYYGVASIYLDAQDHPKSVQALRQAKQVEPRFYKARMRLAVALSRMNESRAALDELEELEKVDEDLLSAFYFSNHILSNQVITFKDMIRFEKSKNLAVLNRNEESLALIEILVKKYPDQPFFLDRKATANMLLGNFEAALSDSRLALKSDTFYCECGTLQELISLNAMSRFSETITSGEAHLARTRNVFTRGRVLFLVATALESLKKNDEALKYYIEAAHISEAERPGVISKAMRFGYYQGNHSDEFSEKLINGLKACLIDPEC